MDGAEISGRFDAVVEQVLRPCRSTTSNTPSAARSSCAWVPAGSPQAPPPTGGEVDYDPDAPDPPDVLQGEAIDLAAYVVEHLALRDRPLRP